MEKVNIHEQLSSLTDYWSQQIVGESNGSLFKVAKGVGELEWHKHDHEDELFILYKGHLTMQLRDKNIELYEGDLLVVPKGVEHRPKAQTEVEFLIVGLNITSNAAGGRPDSWKP